MLTNYTGNKYFKSIAMLTAAIFLGEQILLAAPDPYVFLNDKSSEAKVEAVATDVPPTSNDDTWLNTTNGFLADDSPLSQPTTRVDQELSDQQLVSSNDSIEDPVTRPRRTPSDELAVSSSNDFVGDPVDEVIELDSRLKHAGMTEGSEESGNDTLYAIDRYSVDEAIHHIQDDVATAMILDSISEEGIEQLLDLNVEVGLAALHGELILFTTGNEEEIGILPAARELLKDADLITHTHVDLSSHAQSGPSSVDLQNAVDVPEIEYVLTSSGAYAYNREGTHGRVSHKEYVHELLGALNRTASRGEGLEPHDLTRPQGTPSGQSQTQVRAELNEFIYQMDLYNEASEEERELWRASTNIALQTYFSFDADPSATSGNIVDELDGNDPAAVVSGAPVFTTDTAASNDPPVNFADNPGSLNFNGDDVVQVTDTNMALTNYTIAFWIKPNSFPSSGMKVISRRSESTWNVINYMVDITSDKKVRLVQSQDSNLQINSVTSNDVLSTTEWTHVVATFDGAYMQIYLNGQPQSTLNGGSGVPSSAVKTGSIQTVVIGDNQNTPGTAYLDAKLDELFIYNEAIDPAEISALAAGTHPIEAEGPDESSPVIQSSALNSGSEYASDPSVLLEVTATDTSIIQDVKISFDGVTVDSTHTYSSLPKIIDIPNSQGSHSVYIKVSDEHGNETQTWTLVDSVTLDSIKPTGNVIVTSDNPTTNTLVDLLITQTETNPDQMRISVDGGVTWGTGWMPFNSNPQVTLTEGLGLNTIHVQLRDKAGNVTENDLTTAVTLEEAPIVITPGTFLLDAQQKVVIEAESYINSLETVGGDAWSETVTGDPSAGTAMVVGPDDEGPEHNIGNSPRLDYPIYVPEGEEGDYYIWVRGYAPNGDANSIHVGVGGALDPDSTSDRVWVAPTSGYEWNNLTMDSTDTGIAILTLGSGEQTLNVWMREDGFVFDKIILTKDPNFNPTANSVYGPAESSQATNEPQPDTAAPSVVGHSVNGGSAYSRVQNVVLDVTATDQTGVATVEVSFDGISAEPGMIFNYIDLPQNITLPNAETTHDIYIKVTDDLSYSTGWIQTTSVTLDVTLPTGSLLINEGETVTSPDINLTLTQTEANPDKMKIYVNDVDQTGWIDYQPNYPLTLPGAVGTKVVRVEYQDKAGNVSTDLMSRTVVWEQAPVVITPGTFLLDAEQKVVIEAESYINSLETVGGDTWSETVTGDPSVGTAMVVGPDDEGPEHNIGNSPRLDYPIYVPEGEEGDYYIWVRGYAPNGDANSIHVGVGGALDPDSTSDRVWVAPTSGYEWNNLTMDSTDTGIAILTLGSGEQTLNVWMREDGFVFDKIILTKDPNFNPTSESVYGPSESEQATDTPTPTNTAPVVAGISHAISDVDSQQSGLQVYESTPISLSSSASDADQDVLTWEWSYKVDGGSEVSYLSGSGTISDVNFLIPSVSQTSTYEWVIRVSDGTDLVEKSLTFDVLVAPDPDPTPTELPIASPFTKSPAEAFFAQNVAGVGVVTTDGTYLYVKKWGDYAGSDTFQKIGTGYNGTVQGQDYGSIPVVSTTSLSATYHSDGFIYNPISSDPYHIERIDPVAGTKTLVAVPAGLMERFSASPEVGGDSLITSDGAYLYNVSEHIDDGSAVQSNGWSVRVFDPADNFNVVREFTVGNDSFYTDGVMADGEHIYFIEWTADNTAEVLVARIDTGEIVRNWTLNQGDTEIISGQYDWVNNKFWLGSLTSNALYEYEGYVNNSPTSEVDAEILFTSAASTSSEDYLLTYTVDGQPFQENWKLHPGVNEILVRGEYSGAIGFAKHTVTLTQSEPAVPTMPAIPTLPEDLLELTNNDGLIMKYENDALIAIENPGVFEMYNPVLTGETLTGGHIVFQNGDQVLIENSVPVYKISANNDQTVYYADGNVRSVTTTGSEVIRFAYQMNTGTGEVLSVLSQGTGSSSLYDQNGLPVWTLSNGTETRYEDGMIRRYIDQNGNEYNYTITVISENSTPVGYHTTLTNVLRSGSASATSLADILAGAGTYDQEIAVIENELALEIKYDLNHKITEFTSGLNEKLTLSNGLPTSLTVGSDITTFSSDTENPLNFISSSDNSGSNLTQQFDENGDLSAVLLNDGTVISVNALTANQIVTDDGSVLSEMEWDGTDLKSYLRVYTDGSHVRYLNYRFVESKDAEGNTTFYTFVNGEDRPDRLVTADGRTYKYSQYENGQGLTESITELDRIDLPGGNWIEFKDGKPVRYVQTEEVTIAPLEIPILPNGQSYVPLVELPNAKLRALTINENAEILSGEILFDDGTQYLIENGDIVKAISPFGQFVEFSETALELPVFTDPVPTEPLNAAEEAYRQELIEAQLAYFADGVGVDSATGLPVDNYDDELAVQANYSQSTLVGFWSEILSAVADGSLVTSQMSVLEAYQKLDKMLTSYHEAQTQVGWNGMLSFFSFEQVEQDILDPVTFEPTGETETITVYTSTAEEIGLGDNLNLLVSLSTVLGALENYSTTGSAETLRVQIISTINNILAAQEPGYAQFYDGSTQTFRMTYAPGTSTFSGTMDRVFNEFRTGLFLLAAKSPQYKPAVDYLNIAIKSYETLSGDRIDNAVPFDGGIFQMFWPLIHVDEMQYSEYEVALRNFLFTQAEYASANSIPGLLSAGDNPGAGYEGKIGLPEAAETDDPLLTDVGLIYAVAAAFMVAPHYALQFLKNLETNFPEIRTTKGFVDAMKIQDLIVQNPDTLIDEIVPTPLFSTQFFGVDQASFILSLLGTSRGNFETYRVQNGYETAFNAMYEERTFNLNPILEANPSAPGFDTPATTLYGGVSLTPDGLSGDLGKQASFIPTIFDPEYGEGKIYNYFNRNGALQRTEVEFNEGASPTVMTLQQYILLPGRAPLARSVVEGFSFDLLNEAFGQGEFYTAGEGFSNGVITLDSKLGQVRRIDFELQDLTKPVGIFANYNNLDLSDHDYFTVPVKLGPTTPKGVRVKFEFKGLGEVYVTDSLDADWKYFQFPIVKPATPVTEIAISVQSPDGGPVSGDVFVGPISSFKIRTTKQINWQVLIGKTEEEVEELLTAAVVDEIGAQETVVREEVLEDFKVDSNGKLIEGKITKADGSIQYFYEGRLTKWIFPSGKTVLYNGEGLASFVVDLARGKLEESQFHYDKTFRGQVESFEIFDNDRKRVFDSNGAISQIVESGSFLNFENGVINNIETETAILSNFVFGLDGSLLEADVYLKATGDTFSINETLGEQVVNVGEGVLVYYNDKEIVAIETPENGRTDFTYQYDGAQQLLGVTAIFGATTLPLFDYINLPGREKERAQLLRQDPFEIIPISLIGGYSSSTIPGGEETYALPDDAIRGTNSWYQIVQLREGIQDEDQMGYLFNYDSLNGPTLGAYNRHTANPVTISDYDFLAITLRQYGMDWNQEFSLNLGVPSSESLYSFQIDSTTDEYQTFAFSLAGKDGVESEITLDAIRQAGGVGKTGRVYVKDISYVSLRSLDVSLWEELSGISASLVRQLNLESRTLNFVGEEIANDQAIVFNDLRNLTEIPTWMQYKSEIASEADLSSFRRFDGSLIELDGQNVTKVTLADGTVNEYSATQNAGQGQISGPSTDAVSGGTIDYQYGALRKITQSDGRVYDLTYEFDDEGSEITVLADSLTGDVRRYKNGGLLDATTSDQLETSYTYENGKLAGAELMYKNRVLNSTQFAYQKDETQITDERGTTWFYDADGKLRRHLTKDGYFYEYHDFSFDSSTIETLPEYPAEFDYKTAIFEDPNLNSVDLIGREFEDGSQFILEGKNGLGEIRLASGAHALNLTFDEDGKIVSGQIEFTNSQIIEIDNYVPVLTRLVGEDPVQIILPQDVDYELLQNEDLSFAGFRYQKDGVQYTYNELGRLVKYEDNTGQTDEFTYTEDLGALTSYTHVSKTQVKLNDTLPFVAELELQTSPAPKIVNLTTGETLAERETEGFLISVYRQGSNPDDVEGWDTYSGSFASAGSVFGLEQFLSEIKPGSFVTGVINDPDFSEITPEIIAALEGLGATNVASASTAGQTWSFFGSESLDAGQGIEALDTSVFTSTTITTEVLPINNSSTEVFQEKPLLLNPDLAAWSQFSSFLQSYEAYKLPQDIQINTIYNEESEIVFTERLDGKQSYYEYGKVRETFNREGELLSEHEYSCPPVTGCVTDDDRFLSKITLVKARRDYEAETMRLKEQIEQVKYESLTRLDWQDDVARLSVIQEVDDGVIAINDAISQLEPHRLMPIQKCVRKWWGGKRCGIRWVNNDAVINKINELHGQRAELLALKDEQLATTIPDEIKAKRQEIEDATAERITELNAKKDEIFRDVLRGEIEGVLYDMYRRILGRDPSTAEIDAKVEEAFTNGSIDTQALYTTLNNDPERSQREADKALIISNVETFLNEYLAIDPSDEAAVALKLSAIELTPADLPVQLDASDVAGIMDYLKSRTLHFGQSAFLTLQGLLSSQGVSVDMVTLGTEAILIDIFMGIINKFNEGELLISVFAMNRTGKIHSADFSGVQYTYEDLLALFEAKCPDMDNCSYRVIAHIGEDHFVLVTKVTATEITYIETSKGQNGEEFTVPKEEFLKVWIVGEEGGYLIAPTADTVVEKRLTDKIAQSVRGAFWFLFFFYAAIVLSIASFVVSFVSPTLGKILGYAAMVASIASIVVSVANWVVQGAQAAFSAIGNVVKQGVLATIKGAVVGIGKILVQSVRLVGRFIHKGFTFFKEGFTAGLAKIGEGLTNLKEFLLTPAGPAPGQFTASQVVARQVVAAGLGELTASGLEGLGLDPAIARLGRSFVSAGFLGIGSATSSFFKSGLQGLLLQGVSEIGLKLNLPPPFQGALTSLAGAAINSYFDPELGLKDALLAVAPKVARDLTIGGVGLLGDSLGLDDRITKIVGQASAYFVGKLFPQTPGSIEIPGGCGETNPNCDSSPESETKSPWSVFFEWITGTVVKKLPDFFGGSNNNGGSGGGDPGDPPAVDDEPEVREISSEPRQLENMDVELTQSVEKQLEQKYDIEGVMAETRQIRETLIPQSQAPSSFVNYGQYVQQNGIAKALEDHSLMLFRQSSVEKMTSSISEGTVEAFVNQQINNGGLVDVVDSEGRNLKRLTLTSDIAVEYDPVTFDIVNISEGDVGLSYEDLRFNAELNQPQLVSGKIVRINPTNNVRVETAIIDSQISEVTFSDLEGQLAKITPASGRDFVTTQNNVFLDYTLNEFRPPASFQVEGGFVTDVRYTIVEALEVNGQDIAIDVLLEKVNEGNPVLKAIAHNLESLNLRGSELNTVLRVVADHFETKLEKDGNIWIDENGRIRLNGLSDVLDFEVDEVTKDGIIAELDIPAGEILNAQDDLIDFSRQLILDQSEQQLAEQSIQDIKERVENQNLPAILETGRAEFVAITPEGDKQFETTISNGIIFRGDGTHAVEGTSETAQAEIFVDKDGTVYYSDTAINDEGTFYARKDYLNADGTVVDGQDTYQQGQVFEINTTKLVKLQDGSIIEQPEKIRIEIANVTGTNEMAIIVRKESGNFYTESVTKITPLDPGVDDAELDAATRGSDLLKSLFDAVVNLGQSIQDVHSLLFGYLF